MITQTHTVGLPKWPAMIVKGDSVTPEQATEIILLTDLGFPDYTWLGNDAEYRQQVRNVVGGVVGDFDHKTFSRLREEYGALYPTLKSLDVEYVHNQRVISSCVSGPHGWCDWDGTVFANTHNIGKWPDVDNVAQEWERISQRFPFLNLTCQLFAEEAGENADNPPVVEFIVHDGDVLVREPQVDLGQPQEYELSMMVGIASNNHWERGISLEELNERVKVMFSGKKTFAEFVKVRTQRGGS